MITALFILFLYYLQCHIIIIHMQGRIQGGRGAMPPPPVVSVCKIFLRVVVGVQTYHAAYMQALCQQNC